MRNTIFAFASSALILGAVVVGCGGGGGTTVKHDLGAADMVHVTTGGDMVAPGGMLSCSAYIDCQNACYADKSSTQAEVTACLTACDNNAKKSVVSNDGMYTGLFDVATGCYQLYCIGSFDAAAYYKCGVDATTNQFTEVDGSPISNTGACITCLTDASALLEGYKCSSADSPDCSTTAGSRAASACGSQENACLADK